MTTLAVLIASSGRSTLARTLLSLSPQLGPGDELLVDVNDDAPWGHAARNRLMPRTRAEFLLFMDDDDAYTPEALETIRQRVATSPGALHVFRMRYGPGRELWRSHEVREGNVSTQMIAVPRELALACEWGDRYEGDFDFIAAVQAAASVPACWHEDVIALVRP